MTEDDAQELEQRLRGEIAQLRTLSFISVMQVTDNAGNSRDPYRWSVQLLNTREANVPIYVRSLGHWQAEIKPQLEMLAADD